MRPADTACPAACARAGSPVEIRPLRRTRSAVRAMPGRVAAAVAMAVLGVGEGTSVFISCGGSLACRPGCWRGMSGGPRRAEDTKLGHDGRDVVGRPFLVDLAVGDPVDEIGRAYWTIDRRP